MNPVVKKAFNLQRTFAILSLLAITVISSISGYFLFRYLSHHLLERDMIISAEFIQSVSLINNPDPFFKGEVSIRDNPQIEEFFNHITRIPDVLRATVYNTLGTVIWSDNKQIVGKRFTDNDELEQALTGKPVFARETVTGQDNIEKSEHSFLPDHVTEFVESYLPVWDYDHENVIGVLELYKAPTALFSALTRGKWLVFTISLLGGLLLYAVLFWVVRRASHTIDNQASELQNQINQLSDLLEQNKNLRNRIQHASSRAVEMNENFLRRVGAELHDGPAQSLGFALLRLDAIKQDNSGTEEQVSEFEQVRKSLDEALGEIRSLSAGLVMPELTQLSLRDSIEKVIRNHENRTEKKVEFNTSELPDYCPQPLKICAYRFIQEGLNNAHRHGNSEHISVSAKMDQSDLVITIQDDGPGFDIEHTHPSSGSGLGLLGLRDRIESLGGEFKVKSAIGERTQITAILPIQMEIFANA